MDVPYAREQMGSSVGVCHLAAEKHILSAHLPARVRLSDPERSTLAEIGKRLGRTTLQRVAYVAKPDTILAWYRRLIARKFDGSTFRASHGRTLRFRDLNSGRSFCGPQAAGARFSS